MYALEIYINVPHEVKNKREMKRTSNNEMDRCKIPEWELSMPI